MERKVDLVFQEHLDPQASLDQEANQVLMEVLELPEPRD